MFIILPIIIMFLTATTLIILRFMRPTFKYPWLVAAAGAIFGFASIFIWQIDLPQRVSLDAWQPVTHFNISPTWVADGISWPYALSLGAVCAAVILTSVVRAENDPAAWAGTLLLTALGILAVAAGNPITLILAWSAIDLAELFAMLRSSDGVENNQGVVIAFASRVAGSGLVLLANQIVTTNGDLMTFGFIPENAGIYLLIAAGLRLGIFPLHLPYRKENVLRRGFGSSLRLISAAASLALLARIPASSLQSFLLPILTLLAIIAALYAGWMWLRASDEILGRPFWVLGMASLAIAASLRGNPTGSIGWGIMLILGGGLLFMFSARQRSIIWLPLLSLWGLSALPYSPTASAWQSGNQISWVYIIPFIPAQALLMTGVIRHVLHPGETSLESHERWTKFLYPSGLLLLGFMSILLGLWGWEGARMVGQWWAGILAIVLATGFSSVAFTILEKLKPTPIPSKWILIFRIDWIYQSLTAVYDFFCRVAGIMTASLEGEGGLLWSLLLLALILSVLTTQVR
jgi:hypothetical protein